MECRQLDKVEINLVCTGRFVMYSGITKICYRNTAGHVFTKPVQIEGTTDSPPPVSCFSL
jgi:hypothetical protein